MTVTVPNWQLPGTWLVAVLLLLLLMVPVWGLFRQRPDTARLGWRLVLRAGLHGLLWLAALGLWLNPRWQQPLPSRTLLLVADDVPAVASERVANRLGAKLTMRATAYQRLAVPPPVDTVRLLGQSFPNRLLAGLARQAVVWEPYEAPGQLQEIHWQALLRQGDTQTVTGRIRVEEARWVHLRFGQTSLDSTRLEPGNPFFRLSYPVFSRGRTSLTLWLGSTLLDTLRFVARSAPPLRVRFVLDAPDFETRTLAEWLGQQGNAVYLGNRLSRGIQSELALNNAAAALPADLLITDPANVSNPLISRTLAVGGSVFVLNMTRPDIDLPTVGPSTGTRWAVRRVPGKDTVRVGDQLAAWPFTLLPSPGTLLLPGYPLAVQPGAGGSRVGVSLLLETFPLRLSGDSAAYARLWLSALARLRPPGQDNPTAQAPLIQGQPARLGLTNTRLPRPVFRVGNDSIYLQPNPANSRSFIGMGRFGQTGWLPLQDTLALYVLAHKPDLPTLGNGLQAVARRAQTAAWVRNHWLEDRPRAGVGNGIRTIEKAIPDWGWLLLILLVMSLLWIDAKL